MINRISVFQKRRLLLFVLISTTAWLVASCGHPVSVWGSDKESIASDASITFFVLGDPSAHDDFLPRVVGKIAKDKPDFVLIAGDCVTHWKDQQQWDDFFGIFAPLNQPPTRLYAVPGDRDTSYGGEGLRQGIKNWQTQWDLPGNEIYYSISQESLYVVGLMSNLNTLSYSSPAIKGLKPQLAWLKEDLEVNASSAKWKIAFHHEPGGRFTRLSDPVDGGFGVGVSGMIEPLLIRAGVDLIIRGQHHFYERTYPISVKTGKRDENRGVTFISTGGGSRDFVPRNMADADPLWFDAVIATHRIHYCKCIIAGDNLTWEAIDLNGNTFDRFEIIKQPNGQRKWIGLPVTGKLLTKQTRNSPLEER